MEIHQTDVDAQLSKVEDDGEKEYIDQKVRSDYEILTSRTRAESKTGDSGQRVAGD